MRPGTKAESRSNEGLVFTFTLLLLPSLTIVRALASLHSIRSPAFLLTVFRSRELESAIWWYARGIVQLFLAGTLTVRYTEPAIGSPGTWCDAGGDGDQTGPTYHFFQQGTRIPGFRKAVFHPFFSLLLRNAVLRDPEFPPRNCSIPINLKWAFLKLNRSISSISLIFFLF